MIEFLEPFLWLLALVPAFYLGVPLLIRFQQRMAAHPKFQVLDLESLRPSESTFLMKQTEALFRLGFEEPTLVQIPDAVPNVTSYLIMLINRQSGDKAMVTVIKTEGAVPLKTSYLEFSTRLESGEVFDTLNSPELCAFPPGRTTVRTQVPGVNDPRKLYRVHTFVMDKHGPLGRKFVYEPGQALEYLTKFAFVKTFDEQVVRGWLYYDGEAEVYRPTLKGAYLMTWGLLQPFKALRRAGMEREARKVLEEFKRAHRPAAGDDGSAV